MTFVVVVEVAIRVIMSDVISESNTAGLTDLWILCSRLRVVKQLKTVLEMWVFIDTSLLCVNNRPITPATPSECYRLAISMSALR